MLLFLNSIRWSDIFNIIINSLFCFPDTQISRMQIEEFKATGLETVVPINKLYNSLTYGFCDAIFYPFPMPLLQCTYFVAIFDE